MERSLYNVDIADLVGLKCFGSEKMNEWYLMSRGKQRGEALLFQAISRVLAAVWLRMIYYAGGILVC